MQFKISKSLLLLLLSSSSIVSVAKAVANTNIMDLLPLIPSCALPCILQGVARDPGAIANPSKTCTNVTLQASLSNCLQGACNYAEQSKVALVNMQLCAGVPIDESRKWALFIISIVFGPLSLLTIALRTYSRYAITKKMGGDDWTMIAAGGVMVGVLVANYLNLFRNGFGRHYWNIDPLRATELLQIFYAAEIFYIIEITLVKVSILQFYLRVFPTKWFRLATIATLALVIAACIGVLLPIIIQCNPINAAWDRSINNAKCININLLAYATGGIGVGFDLIILALPVSELLKLKMSNRKKIHVLLMFSLGSIACVISIIRLKYLADFTNSTDQTWDNVIPVIWSLVEICIAIICACLPSLRALLAYHIPRYFSGDTTASSFGQYSHQLSDVSGAYLSSARDRTIVSKLSSQSRASQTFITSVIGTEEKDIPLESITTSKNPWSPKSAFMGHNREVSRDIEQHPQLPEEDSFVQGLKIHNQIHTITTKIWVDNIAAVNHAPKLHRSNSVSVDKYTHQTSHFETHSAKGTSINNTLSSHPPQKLSRAGSEDSIFALEGPRESDSDSVDERQGGLTLRKFDFQSGKPVANFDGSLGLDMGAMTGNSLVPAPLRRSESANGGTASTIRRNMSLGSNTIKGDRSSGNSTIRPETSGSTSNLIASTHHIMGERENGRDRNSVTGVAVALRVGSRPDSSAVIPRVDSSSGIARPGSAAVVGDSRNAVIGNGSNVRPAVENRPGSRGNRYDAMGRLRRNGSLDLRGGEVKIPVSVFSAVKSG